MQRLGSQDYWIDLYAHGSKLWWHTTGPVAPEAAASTAHAAKPDARRSKWRLPWKRSR